MSEGVRWVSAADGTKVAYSIVGDGPALMLSNGLTTSTPFWKYLRAGWTSSYRVITWDLPGHGRSAPPNTRACLEIEAQPDIMVRIMDAEGIARATHIGFSVGCQIVLEMARQERARCDALVLLLGTAGNVFSTLRLPVGRWTPHLLLALPAPLFSVWYRSLARAARFPLAGTLAKSLGLIGARIKDADLRELLMHLTTLDPLSLQYMARCAQRHSAHDILATLSLPLLIVAGDSDPFAPLESVGRMLHEAAPGSQLVELAGATHTAMLEDPDAILDAVGHFLASLGARAPTGAGPPLPKPS
jgi:3-oxoadipate enol-lactonase/4-carboxymuconolactone decarboxylase